jgi:hypothetical protein
MQDPSKPVVPFPLWIGACLAADALITGNIHWSSSYTLSRADSPFTFWLFVLFAMAVAIFGTRWEIRNRDALWEDGEILRRKIFLSIGLFFFLLLVYATFLFNHPCQSPARMGHPHSRSPHDKPSRPIMGKGGPPALRRGWKSSTQRCGNQLDRVRVFRPKRNCREERLGLGRLHLCG